MLLRMIGLDEPEPGASDELRAAVERARFEAADLAVRAGLVLTLADVMQLPSVDLAALAAARERFAAEVAALAGIASQGRVGQAAVMAAIDGGDSLARLAFEKAHEETVRAAGKP